MNILKKNKLYRALAFSAFFNKFGASMYNLVFITFAASMEANKIAVGIANIVVLIPVFLLFLLVSRQMKLLKKLNGSSIWDLFKPFYSFL